MNFQKKYLLNLVVFLLIGNFGLVGQTQQKPNVLFIAIDDQNDWLGFMGGHPLAKTPNLDALANSGTAFNNAHCQSPLCNPSRTSLLLSLRPSSSGIYGLAPWFRDLPEYNERVALPQYFKNNGYKTLTAGKIFHASYGREKGSSEFDVFGPGASAMPLPPKKLVETQFGNHNAVDWGTFPHKDEDKGDYKLASWAIEQLSVKHEKPFFLSVGFYLPHVPIYVTPKWYEMYPDNDTVLPEILRNDREDTPRFAWYLHWYLPEVRRKWLEEKNQWRNICRSYLAASSFIDAQVGRVMKALKDNGLEENTIVVVWSDHGFHLGEKDITGKNTLWRESTRVPLIFAGPGIKPQTPCGKPAELLDIYPTLLELCGLPANDKLEGISLVPQLQNREAERVRPAITTHNHDNHSIRSEKWSYIVYVDGSEELYDAQKDPHEWTNLAAKPEYKVEIEKLREFIPKVNKKPAKGSKSRILTYENGKLVWEGKEIKSTDPIPGIED